MLLFDNTKQFEGVVQQVLLSEAPVSREALRAKAVDAVRAAMMPRAERHYIHVACASPSPCSSPRMMKFAWSSCISHPPTYRAAQLGYPAHVLFFFESSHGRGQSSGTETRQCTAEKFHPSLIQRSM